jgi:hypothetical protein
MSNSKRATRRFTVGCALGACLQGLAAQTVAQDQERGPNDVLEEIVVTGSRIARPDDDRLQPTTILTGEHLDRRGNTYVLDALNEPPEFGQLISGRIGPPASEGVGQSFCAYWSGLLGTYFTVQASFKF